MGDVVPIRGAGRPQDCYRLADGTRVPGTTTITGYMKGAALLKWAWRQGRDGKELYGARDEAGVAGSIAHQWIEDTLHGTPPTAYDDAPAELLAQARAGFDAFREWHAQSKPVILETEVPLVSERYRYGGTIDAIALIGDVRCLLDWKTSNGTYPDYIAQVAAYRELLRERDGDRAPERAYLLRVGKEYADFHFHSWPMSVLDLGWKWFQAAHELYVTDRQLKKVAA